MEIVLTALVAAAVSGTVVLVAPRLRRRPALADGAGGTVRSGRSRRASHPNAHPAPGANRPPEERDTAHDERPPVEREAELADARAALEEARQRHLRELERVTGLSVPDARRALLAELEQGLRHERARLIRQVEDEARHGAERRARSILVTCMQRVAGAQS